MTQLGALAYADWRAFVNDLRNVRKSPGRIVMWTVYVLALSLFFVSRVLRHSGPHSAASDVARADYVVAALLVTLALSLASGRGAIGIFRSRVEARFIIGSPVVAPLAIAYLQAREALAQGLRLLLSLVYFSLFIGPRTIGPVAVLADLALVLAVTTAAAAIVVPRRLLSGPAATVCVAVGVAIALLALAPALRDVVGGLPVPVPLATRVTAVIPAWHPGYILLEPRPIWLLLVLAIAAAAIAVLAAAGRDAYPELYALSIARIERVERLGQRFGRSRRDAQPATALGRVLPAPRGVLIFVWKSIVEFGRRGQRPFIIAGAVGWCVAGFAAARFVAVDEAALFATLTGVIINVLLIVGIGAVNGIAGEVRRPLFWLAPTALFERLCALALAQIWRTVATLELAAVGFVLGGGSFEETIVLAIGLPALVALLAGVGFAVFALFPSVADGRGPVAALRLVVSVFLLVPPLVLYFVIAFALGARLAALAATVVLALIEAGGLIGIAAWRLDGHVDRLAA